MNIMKKKLNVVYLDTYEGIESSLRYTYLYNSKVDDDFSKNRFFITKDEWSGGFPNKNIVKLKNRLIICDDYLSWKDELLKNSFLKNDLFLIVIGNIYLTKSNIMSILCGYKDDKVILLTDCSKELNYKSILLMNYDELVNLDVNLKDIENVKIVPSGDIKQFNNKKEFNDIHRSFFKSYMVYYTNNVNTKNKK